ncbi:MAG: putative peptidoglycan glycosyltransferase FtsW [Sphaerochaeta sp.]|jgi:cell division protein FtsW|nr:putative lipid II flippase FtsW [Sphaerochaeta sp.]MDX9915974.1 putative peptidoglycan glycosyltransferase FtsW [Sphaerochaeta sp.]
MDEYNDYLINTRPAIKGGRHVADNAPFLFALVTVLLTAIGLVMLYSASYNEALSFELDHAYFFYRQLTFALYALVPIALVILLPSPLIRRLSPLSLLAVVVLLGLTLFSSYGQQKFGSRRWLEIAGLPSIQPSEFAKIAIALYYGSYFSRRGESALDQRIFITPALVALVVTALILAGRDYSSALLLLAQCCAMLVASGLRWQSLVVLFGFVTPPALVALLGQGYRIRRVASFLLPTLDPSGINYQVSVSLKAIRRGGVFGVGLGNGVYKEGLLPEVHSDFIFASICEEIGLVGVTLIITLFIIFIHLGYTAARRRDGEDRFLSLVAFGLTTMIALQALLNLFVVTGLLPPTGVPLPFFSQGGTSLVVVLTSCAFIYRALAGRRQ